jgi:hypothetical protein
MLRMASRPTTTFFGLKRFTVTSDKSLFPGKATNGRRACRIPTRCDKLAASYLHFQLASIRLWLRAYESTPQMNTHWYQRLVIILMGAPRIVTGNPRTARRGLLAAC